eukprot:6175918-Pleurochrysis_carterae.AAC.2
MRLLFASTPQPRRGHVPQPRLRTSIATAAAMGADTTTKKIGGAKNGGTRVVPNKKAPGYYPADDVKVKVKGASKPPTPAKLRSSIKPGSVLILLAGRFRGRRVVFLKQLPSGLLLVTGPYAVNGIPVRRVNQAYVIATSTTVDISKVDVSKFEDGYFGKPKVAKKKQKKSSDEFFAEEQPVRTSACQPSLACSKHMAMTN